MIAAPKNKVGAVIPNRLGHARSPSAASAPSNPSDPATFLLQHFDRLAEAPGGIANLRALVLQLAVTGKLSPQIKIAERTTRLLGQIRAEKARITRKLGATTPIDRSKVQVSIPAEWEWIRLGDLCSKTGSGSTPRGGKAAYSHSGIPFLRSQNVYDDGLRLDGVAYITPAIHEQMSGTAVLPGDLLLNITGGSIGRCAIVPESFVEGNVSQHVAILRPAVAGMSRYLHLVILSPHFQTVMLGSQTGAGREGLPKNRMDEILIPLPPLAEQQRIVAKVEELMGLCDALEAAQQQRDEVRTRLRTSTLHQLASPDLDSRSAAFVLDHLPRFTAVKEDLTDIRKSVLLLAVEGKLANQDPREEPAVEQLKRISGRKAALLKSGKFRQGKVAKSHTSIELEGPLPAGWTRTNIDSLCFKVTDGTHFTPTYVSGGVRFVSAKDIVGGRLVFDRCKFIPHDEHQQLFRRCNPEYHDIVISKSGSIGSVALVEDRGEFSLFESLALLKFDQQNLSPAYLVNMLTHVCGSLSTGHIRGVGVKHLHLDIMRGVEISLPPLAEQRRIVAKVDELMSVLDALEAALTTARATSEKLLAATIARLNEPAVNEAPALLAAEASAPYGS